MTVPPVRHACACGRRTTLDMIHTPLECLAKDRVTEATRDRMIDLIDWLIWCDQNDLIDDDSRGFWADVASDLRSVL